MKNLCYTLCILFLLFSCEMDSNGSAPVLKKVVIAPTQAMIDAGIDATVFSVTDFIRFHYTVTDEDGDFDKAVISFINGNGETVETRENPYGYPVSVSGAKSTETGSTIAYNQGTFGIGSWSISVYYLDKAGNKSETVVKSFNVTE